VLTELGLTVTRSIPLEQLGGLLSGAYSLHGGVIRDGAGRIVSHLVSSGTPNALTSLVPGLNTLSSVIANGQLYSLGRDVAAIQSTVSTVLNVASAGAVLSGLGLVTSIAGFAYLHKRLNVVDKQLAELLDIVKDIKQTLMYQQFANLRAAVKLMQHAERADDHEVRRGKLLQANEGMLHQQRPYSYHAHAAARHDSLALIRRTIRTGRPDDVKVAAAKAGGGPATTG